jgi:hypothetical protein
MFLTRLKICRKGSSKISKEPEIRESTRRLTRTGGSSESNVKQTSWSEKRKHTRRLVHTGIDLLQCLQFLLWEKNIFKKKKKRKENCVKSILLFSV